MARWPPSLEDTDCARSAFQTVRLAACLGWRPGPLDLPKDRMGYRGWARGVFTPYTHTLSLLCPKHLSLGKSARWGPGPGKRGGCGEEGELLGLGRGTVGRAMVFGLRVRVRPMGRGQGSGEDYGAGEGEGRCPLTQNPNQPHSAPSCPGSGLALPGNDAVLSSCPAPRGTGTGLHTSGHMGAPHAHVREVPAYCHRPP